MDDPLSQELFSLSGKERSSREELLQKCRDTISLLQQDLEQEREMRVDAESLNAQLQQDLEELQEQLHAVKVKDYSRLLEVEQNDVAYGNARKKIAVYQEELTKSQQDRASLKSQNDDLRAELQKAQRLLSEAREELNKSKAAVADWSASLTSVETKLKLLTKDNNAIKDANKSISKEFEDQARTVEIQQEQIQRLQGDLRSLEERMQNAKNQLKAEEETRKLAQQKYMEGFSLQASQFQEALSESKAATAAAQRDSDEAKREIGRLKDRLKESQTEADALEQTKSALEQQTSDLQADIHTLQATLQSHETDSAAAISRLKTDLDSSRNESKALREQIDTCQARLEGVTFKASQLEQALDRAKREIAQTTEEKDEAAQEVMRQRAEFQDQLRTVKEQHRKDLQNLLEENRLKLEAALGDYQAELEQELGRREEAEEGHMKEAQTLKDAYQKLMIEKEEEVGKLNQDRERLREAVLELESKLVLLSRTFEDRTNVEQRRDRKAKNRLALENESLKEQIASLQGQLIHESELFKSESRRKDEEIGQMKRQSEERIARRTAAIAEQADLKILEMKEKCLKELAYLSKLMTSVELEGRSNTSTNRIGDYLKGIIDRLEQMVDSRS